MYFHKKLSKKYITIFYLIYTILFIYFLFFKTFNIQGMNLNFFNIINDIKNGQFILILFNIFLFIPIGFLKPNIKLSILLIIIIELLQYTFHVGIFDIIDIFTNSFGVILGYYSIDWLKQNHIINY